MSKLLKQILATGDDFIVKIKEDAKRTGLVIVISKKVAKLAVDRNRIRRLFKEALKSLNFKEGEIKIVVKKNISEYKMPEVQKALEKWLKK